MLEFLNSAFNMSRIEKSLLKSSLLLDHDSTTPTLMDYGYDP